MNGMKEVMLQVYLLYFDTESTKYKADILILNGDNKKLDDEINRVLQSTGYEFYDYSDEITILVDDQGMFKYGNPVFEVISDYGDTTQLAGRLIFARNIENDFSMDIGSLTSNDIFHLRQNLKIKLLGLTRGV